MSEMQVEPQNTFASDSRFGVFVHTDRQMPAVMGLVFLPWLAVVFLTAGAWAALNMVGYALIVLAAGYSVLCVALTGPARVGGVVLAPALGVLTISASSALWLRLGFPLIWLPALWLFLVAPGIIGLWFDRALWTQKTIAYGGTMVALSTLICLAYLLPSARNDAVLRSDGSFNWIYVDTQFNYAIAADIKSGDRPPKAPGTVTQELLYHFGPYVPAAAISRLDGLDLGDSLARVTRGASLWALVLSCFGVGTLLSLKCTGGRFGGIMSVPGLFFYGSLLSLFTDERNSSSHVSGAILFKIPGVDVLADGGPFSHLILGHSMLHGLIAITASMGLCLVSMERESASNWRELVLLTLPALAVPMHSVAALYCVSVVGILLFWKRLGSMRSWLLILLMLALFLAAWRIMGYSHAPDAVQATIKSHLTREWWPLSVCFLIGLGFRILGFRWISGSLKEPIAALVLASTFGMVLFSILFQLDGNERYGIYFLQSMFSIFAFSRLKHGFWHGAARIQWTEEWLRLARKGMILFALCALLIAVAAVLTNRHTGIDDFRVKILLTLLVVAVTAGSSALMKRSRTFSTAGSLIVMAILWVGFFAWITPWLNFGMGRMEMDVTISPGEFQGLNRLRKLDASGERFATNKHEVDSLAENRERSYQYGALAERPVLLEGYLYRGESKVAGFQSLLRDNDLMFTTTNPQTLREIAKAWHIRWLVARPGSDIALPRPLPSWLVQQQDCGDLRIYQID
jgi:hypothetical protein